MPEADFGLTGCPAVGPLQFPRTGPPAAGAAARDQHPQEGVRPHLGAGRAAHKLESGEGHRELFLGS